MQLMKEEAIVDDFEDEFGMFNNLFNKHGGIKFLCSLSSLKFNTKAAFL